MPHEDGLLAGAPSSPAQQGVHGCGRSRRPTPTSVAGVGSPQPFFGGSMSINQISGKIVAGQEVLARLSGHWVRGRPRGGQGGRRARDAGGAPDPARCPRQDREVFLEEEGRGGPELFWDPSGEAHGRRLRQYTVLLHEQTELESER